jgi:hypothetical protein
MSAPPAKLALLLLTLLLPSLGACVTAEEVRQQDEASCVSYGFQRGTPEFAGCLQQEALSRRYISYMGLYDQPYLGWPARPWWYVAPTR